MAPIALIRKKAGDESIGWRSSTHGIFRCTWRSGHAPARTLVVDWSSDLDSFDGDNRGPQPGDDSTLCRIFAGTLPARHFMCRHPVDAVRSAVSSPYGSLTRLRGRLPSHAGYHRRPGLLRTWRAAVL